MNGDAMAVAVGSARACPADRERSEAVCVLADEVPPGWVLAATTYNGGAEQISTDGVPRWLRLDVEAGALPDHLWAALDQRYRVAAARVTLTAETEIDDFDLVGLHD